MKKQYLITGLLFVLAFKSYSQSIELNEWISAHPSVNFINENRLQEFSANDLALIDGNYIVFSGEINEKDLIAFDPAYLDKKNHTDFDEVSLNTKFDKASFVKQWLSAHPNVKIVKRSEYNLSDSNTQLEYVAKSCLVLIGETLTKEDIELFHP